MSDTEDTPNVDEPTTVDNAEAPDEPQPEAGETYPPDTDSESDTFPRYYVERLRRESAGQRERANAADTYDKRLHTELVRATGRLADPTDLEFAEDHLDGTDALAAALDDLLTREPHLASRRPTGDIGQGASSSATRSVDLVALLRERAL